MDSDVDSLFGDDSDDENHTQPQSTESQMLDTNTDFLLTDDMELEEVLRSPNSKKQQNETFSSPASVKSNKTSGASDNDSDNDSEEDRQSNRSSSPRKKKDKAKRASSKAYPQPQQLKKEKKPTAVAAASEKTAVEMEIEAVKKIERGPTEAELRRRALIEIDQDELEERVERLNRAALHAMSSCTGLTKQEQRQQLRECRVFLAKCLQDPELEEAVQAALDKQSLRSYGEDGVPGVDALVYLSVKEEDYSDDEADERRAEQMKEPTVTAGQQTAAHNTVTAESVPPQQEQEGVMLSDSEDEEEKEEEATMELPLKQEAVAVEIVAVGVNQPPVKVLSAAELRQQAQLEARKQRYYAAMAKPKSSRAALLTSLRQRVQETAHENYCVQVKVSSEALAVRLQIGEKSRVLVELLKEKHEARSLSEREARRQRYEAMAAEEEDEFSENDDDELAEGQFLTDAERAAFLRSFGAENEEEEEENTDDIDIDEEQQQEEEEENGEADGKDALVADPLLEELESAAAAMDTQRDDGERSTGAAVTSSIDTEDDEEEEEVTVAAVRGSKTARVVDEDDEAPTSEVAQSSDAASPAAPVRSMVTYGRKSKPAQSDSEVTAAAAAAAAAAAVADGDAFDLDAESLAEADAPAAATEEMEVDDEQSDSESTTANDAAAAAKMHKAKKSHRTGNAMFRLQLEEEERRHRAGKKSGLLDEEAEEEEEEDHQRGLGDFGFGGLDDLRERDEEKNALRLQKGDLDHIVDDVSDGEGDEAAGALARIDMEIREDRERTKAVITAVTEGHDAARKKAKKGKYSFEALVNGDKKKVSSGAAEAEPEEEDLDEEEMLQAGMALKADRERGRRRTGGDASDSESEEEDVDEEAAETEMAQLLGRDDLSEEQRAAEVARLQTERELDRIDYLRRKQHEEHNKMRREMRRQAKRAALAPVHAVPGADSQFLPKEPLSSIAGSGAHSIKRRTSLAPKHVAPGMHRRPSNPLLSRSTSTGPSGPPLGNPPLNRATSMSAGSHSRSGPPRAPSTATANGQQLQYGGELKQSEVLAGYGMGMAAPSSGLQRSRSILPMSESADSNLGLFSAVTGLKRASSDGLASGSMLKRSFSSSVKRRTGTSAMGSTVASHQFVFSTSSSVSMHGAGAGFDAMGGGGEFSNMGGGGGSFSRSVAPHADSSSGFGNEASSSHSNFGPPSTSLFAKLGAHNGLLKKSKTMGR